MHLDVRNRRSVCGLYMLGHHNGGSVLIEAAFVVLTLSPILLEALARHTSLKGLLQSLEDETEIREGLGESKNSRLPSFVWAETFAQVLYDHAMRNEPT
jgi:hypothetical protein